MIIDDEIWVTLNKYLITLLKVKYKEKHRIDKFEYEDMVKLLASDGIQISNVALRKKVSRGRFSAQFLLQLMVVLDVDLSSREIKAVLDNSRVVLALLDKANASKPKGGNQALIADMLRVSMNIIDASGKYPSVNTISDAALAFPYRSRLSIEVFQKLSDTDTFTLSLFDALHHAEKEQVMKDFENLLFTNANPK